MTIWNRANIGIKFILTAFPVMAVIVILFGWYFIKEERAMFRSQLDSVGNSITQATASFSMEPLLLKNYSMIKTYTDNLVRGNKDIVFVYILRTDGTIVSNSSIEARFKVAPFVYERSITIYPTHLRSIGKVVLGLSPKTLNEAISDRVFDIAMATSVLFVAFTLVIVFLVRMVVTEPLKQLGDNADALGRGDFESPITIDNQDEVGRLANILETMRTNLRSSYSMIQQQNDQLKSLDKMKDEFLANMSHELKTPLNAIIGYSQLAKDDVKNQVVDQVLGDLDKIENSGRQLLKIVNDILSLSSDSAASVNEPYSVVALIDEIRIGFETEAYKNNNKTLVQFHHHHDYVKVDVIKLKQMLLHLLNNANKFTHGGTVTIDIYDEKIQDVHWLSISVGDDGIGIDEEHLESVFLPFRQVDSSSTRKYEGTGLGLAVCKNLCVNMGGEISVTSEKGRGSIFHVKLPLAVVTAKDFDNVQTPLKLPTAGNLDNDEDSSIVNM